MSTSLKYAIIVSGIDFRYDLPFCCSIGRLWMEASQYYRMVGESGIIGGEHHQFNTVSRASSDILHAMEQGTYSLQSFLARSTSV